MCDDCPASFSTCVVHIGPPGMANGRIRARKVGYDLSTQWAKQRYFPVKQSLFGRYAMTSKREQRTSNSTDINRSSCDVLVVLRV